MVQLKQALTDATSQKEMLSAELGFTQKELEEDIKKIAAMESEIKKLHVALRGSHEQQDELERERALLKSEITNLKHDIDVLTEERDNLSALVADLTARIAALQKQCSQVAIRIDQLQRQIDDDRTAARSRYDELAASSAATAARQAGQIDALAAETTEQKERIRQLEARVAQLEKSESELTRLNHQYQLQLQVVKVCARANVVRELLGLTLIVILLVRVCVFVCVFVA